MVKNNCLRLSLIHDRFEVAWSNPTETDKKAGTKERQKDTRGQNRQEMKSGKLNCCILGN